MLFNKLPLFCFLLIPQRGHFIKKVSVVSEKDELYTDRTSQVRCNFTKWKREQLLSVTWSLHYRSSGGTVKTDFLRYSPDGTETPSSTFIVADPDTIEEKKIDLRVLYGSDPEDEVDICCEVKVISDSYGNHIPRKKESCSSFKIVKEFIGPSLKPLEVDIMSSHTKAEVGDNVDITCVTKDDYKPKPSFAILVNGQVVERDDLNRDGNGKGLQTTLTLTEEHFHSNRQSQNYIEDMSPILVECVGKVGNIVSQSNLTITRNRVFQQARQQTGNQILKRQGWSGQSFILLEKRGSLNSYDRSNSVIHGQVPDEVLEDVSRPRKIGNNRDQKIETSDDVVTLLNTFGAHGYQVKGVANSGNSLVWTLSRDTFSSTRNDL